MAINIDKIREFITISKSDLAKEKRAKELAVKDLKVLIDKFDEKMLNVLRERGVNIDYIIPLNEERFVTDSKYFSECLDVLNKAKEVSITILEREIPNVKY